MKFIKKILQKRVMFTLFITFSLLAVSCEKDVTDTTDITNFQWELKCIKLNEEVIKPRDKEYLRDDAFILFFENDSTFRLNTSVNIAHGSYLIPQRGIISVSHYTEHTKVAALDMEDKKLDESLLIAVNAATKYTVRGTLLIFDGVNVQVLFKRH